MFVFSLNRNNFTTIVRGLSVLLSLLLHFLQCSHSNSMSFNPSFCTNIYWTFSLQSFHVCPFICFIPSNLKTYRHTLGLFGIHKFLGYHCLAFLVFILPCQPFPLNCFCVNSGHFLRLLISLLNPCISCIISLKLPLIKL